MAVVTAFRVSEWGVPPSVNEIVETDPSAFVTVCARPSGSKFEKVSLFYVRHGNMFLIVSVEPNLSLSPIVECVNRALKGK